VKRSHGGIVNPPCNRKGKNGNPSPTGRRARGLSQQSGVADVDAVEKRNHEKSEEKGQEAPCNAAARGQAGFCARAQANFVHGSGHGYPVWASNITKRGLHANERLGGG